VGTFGGEIGKIIRVFHGRSILQTMARRLDQTAGEVTY